MTSYLKRLTSILADLSPTPIRARSLEFTAFQSTSRLLAMVRGSMVRGSMVRGRLHGLFRETV